MVAFLSGAVLAEAASIDGIVGAFFAGLGLNRAIPERSELMERVQFIGSSLFIPIFLVSVGVLLEPKVMIDPKTLLVALVFTIAVLGGKSLAAVIAGRVRSTSRWPEIGVMCGALRLAGGRDAGHHARRRQARPLRQATINAVLVVILASLVVTPALVTFFGKKVSSASGGRRDARRRGARAGLGRLDAAAARRGRAARGGRLPASSSAASFAAEDAPEAQAGRAAQPARQSRRVARQAEGLEAQSIFRVSRSLAAGLLQTVRGENATLAHHRVALRRARSETATRHG